MRGLFGAVIVIVGCGGGGGGTTHRDAAAGGADAVVDAPVDMAIDSRPADAAPLVDGPPPPAGHTHYVIDQITLPTTNNQARTLGLDLNGDMTVDNQLGMVMATLAGMGFDIQTPMNVAIDRGASIMLADLGADDLMNTTNATFTIYQGADPMPAACASPQDTVCRNHLAGTGSFSLAANAPVDTPLAGAIVNNKLTAGPGHLSIQLSLFGSAPVTVTLLGARVELTSTSAMSTGKLTGGMSMTDVNMKIIPAMRDAFAATVMKDCTMLANPPACGCASGSQGATLLGLFDVNPKDCTISLAEVQNNALIVSLLAPDVIVENTMALSVGVGAHAVPGAFVAP